MRGIYVLGIIAGLLTIWVTLVEVLYTIHDTYEWRKIRRLSYTVSSGFWVVTGIVFMLSTLA